MSGGGRARGEIITPGAWAGSRRRRDQIVQPVGSEYKGTRTGTRGVWSGTATRASSLDVADPCPLPGLNRPPHQAAGAEATISAPTHPLHILTFAPSPPQPWRTHRPSAGTHVCPFGRRTALAPYSPSDIAKSPQAARRLPPRCTPQQVIHPIQVIVVRTRPQREALRRLPTSVLLFSARTSNPPPPSRCTPHAPPRRVPVPSIFPTERGEFPHPPHARAFVNTM
ncbi:hypothetical protein B0H14DRAFT_3899390 [Mycena olivaceomarginata]|nr:hypothetical protein B0H14DRAFT_3899390 [Mycena olivaceomarginata]